MTKPRLAKSMTVEQFDNGYWYALEIKAFADEIGIPAASKLRKDELEELIKHFLRTGSIRNPTRKTLARSGVRDVERGLSLKLPVVSYTNDRETKDFIVQEALKIAPRLKRRSGGPLSTQPLARAADRKRHQDHLPGRGEGICEIESDARQFPTGSGPFGQIHKFSLRFFGRRKERNQGAGAQGLASIEEG